VSFTVPNLVDQGVPFLTLKGIPRWITPPESEESGGVSGHQFGQEPKRPNSKSKAIAAALRRTYANLFLKSTTRPATAKSMVISRTPAPGSGKLLKPVVPGARALIETSSSS
jgi:hypothetical protein